MAIGRIPYYTEQIRVEDLTTEQFLILAFEVARNLKWDLTYKRIDGFTAFTKFRKRLRNEKIHLYLDDGMATMRSESTAGQFIDWGRNKRNIDDFKLGFYNSKISFSPDELSTRYIEFYQKLSPNEITGFLK